MSKKTKVTDSESKSLNSMSKNMQKFLNDTKGIPCKIIQLNAGETAKDDDGNEKPVPGIFEIVGIRNKKGSKRFPWKITFDLNDEDDKGKFRRHLLLGTDSKINFIVSTNAQLMFLLDFYQEPKPKAKSKPKAKVATVTES